MIKRRKRQGKTDYKARIALLKSGKGRVVFRKTNKYIIGQYVKSEEGRDYVVVGVTSKKLLEYGWADSAIGSLKSISACYLTGFLLGKKIGEREEKEGIFDLGLLKSIPKSRAYAFLKGIIDSGIEVKVKEGMFPKIEEGKISRIKEKIIGEK